MVLIFRGMIVDAISCVNNGSYRHPYKYVLIDEYQDMSRPRYELIRALRLQHDFSLFCVGDDWQSIYRFAGSDLHLILDFDRIWHAWVRPACSRSPPHGASVKALLTQAEHS